MSRLKTVNRSYRSTPTPVILRLKIILLGALITVIFALWMWYGGIIGRWMLCAENFIYEKSSAWGFVVKDLQIDGLNNTYLADLTEALGVSKNSPFLKFSLKESHQNISQLPWVDSVTIKRQWPQSIQVSVTERIPMALWQYKQKISLIDTKGNVIPIDDMQLYVNLPLVLGNGAPEAAQDLLKDIKEEAPDLCSLMIACVRIGKRRWNIKLKNGITLMLPESRYQKEILKKFSVLEKSHHLLQTAKTKIDWRLKNKLILS